MLRPYPGTSECDRVEMGVLIEVTKVKWVTGWI